MVMFYKTTLSCFTNPILKYGFSRLDWFKKILFDYVTKAEGFTPGFNYKATQLDDVIYFYITLRHGYHISDPWFYLLSFKSILAGTPLIVITILKNHDSSNINE